MLRLTRTSGSAPGPVVVDSPDFKATNCAYHYNLPLETLGAGSYVAEVVIDGTPVGEARFRLE